MARAAPRSKEDADRQSIRSELELLRDTNELVEINVPVDREFELSAILERQGQGPAIRFNSVKGYDGPVVGNLLSSRAKMAFLLGVEESELLSTLVHAIDHPIPPAVRAHAACQEEIHGKDFDLLKILPLGRQCAREQGPYITAGVFIVKDPATGRENISINRALVVAPDRLMVGMAPSHHLYRLALAQWAAGRPLEVAIAIGNPAAVILASNAYVGYGDDELAIAGALLREPLRVASCQTIDVEVPALAEVVVEAEFRPNETHEEGLVSEFHGLYEDYGPSPVGHVRAISHRRDFIFHNIAASRVQEHMLIGAVMIEATLFRAIRAAVPSVRNVHVTFGGGGRMHCIVALHNPPPGEGPRAVFAALAHANIIKHVVVVDDDIDIFNLEEVEWAIATRFRADRDIFVVPRVRADRVDPVRENRTVAKWGLIALKDAGQPMEVYERARAPQEILEQVNQRWVEYFAK
ncbi:MAG: UbiD family decarboxylase [Candidatus Binatia bacterium]